jgi:hypothetical protein
MKAKSNVVTIMSRLVYHKIAKIEINVPSHINAEDITEWLYENEHLYSKKLDNALSGANLDFGFGFDADEGFDDYASESETRFDFLDGEGGSMGGHL